MLASRLAFDKDDPDFFNAIPAEPAVFLLRSNQAEEAEPYVSKTANLRKRLSKLLLPAQEGSKRLNLRDRIAEIEYTLTGSDFGSNLLLYRTLRQLFPDSYRKRFRIRFAPLIKIGWENAYPRAYVTRRLRLAAIGDSSDGKTALYYGPFRSRAVADKFLNAALDLFKSRRCTFELAPDPAFPGCIYSEMKMCLAPCFKGCPDEDYHAEMRRVQAFLDSRGHSLVAELETQRERASADLDFEGAAALHARVGKVKGVTSGLAELVQRIDLLDAVVVQRSPSTDQESVTLYRFAGGRFSGPVIFSVAGMRHPNEAAGSTSLFAHPIVLEPVPAPVEIEEAEGAAGLPAKEAAPRHKKLQLPTLESRIAAAISELAGGESEGPAAEQLALLQRWFYRNSRTGEIFFAENGEFPLRRIARGISRVYRREPEPAEPAEGVSARAAPPTATAPGSS